MIVNPRVGSKAEAPTIDVSTDGLITATAGDLSSTKQLTTQAATTITPGTATKTAVAAGRYTTGAVKVAGDTNLVAGNIVSGVSIFGVAGSYSGVNLNMVTPDSISVNSSGTITIPVTGITPSSILVSVCIPFRLINETTRAENLIGGGYYYNNTPWIILDICTDSYVEVTAYEVTIGNGYIKIENGLYSLFNSQGSFDVTIMSDHKRIPQVCFYNT